MKRVKFSRSVANIKKTILITILLNLLWIGHLWAQGKFSTDPISSSYFYWLIVITITFVQGALNGFLVLMLRSYKYEYSGHRWSEAFWSGFPLAFISSLLTGGLIEMIHGDVYISKIGAIALILWLICFLILNVALTYELGKWAAKE
jgi:hypothetical protein